MQGDAYREIDELLRDPRTSILKKGSIRSQLVIRRHG